MNRYILKKYYLILALLSIVSLQLRAADTQTNEVALSFTSALASSTGTTASSTVGDITFSFSGSNVSYSTDHVTLEKGDQVKVAQVSGSGSTITGITFYLYGTDNGELSTTKGTFSSNVWTGSETTVSFKNSSSNDVAIQAIVVTYTKSSTVSFSAQEETYSLKDLYASSANTATSTTSGATITYFVLNTKVAQIDANGYLRFVNDGWTTVSGSDGTNTAYYVAHITTQEIEPSDYVNGNVLDMSKATTEGEIDATSVKLPYMTIGIGSTSETAVLKNLGTTANPHMGMVCLDANGYNHAEFKATTPTMGTYFSFTPLTNGTLTVKGYFNSNNSTTNANAQLYLNGTAVSGTTITYSASDYQSRSASLEAGKTYYLFVPTTDGTYDYFCPYYISYDSKFYFATKSVRVTSGSTYTQIVNGASSSTTYSVKAKGDLSASVTTDGVVTWSGEGGALVVTATDGNNSDFYVITVPYTTHTWSFIDPVPNWTTMQSNTKDWQFYYKVRQYTDGSLTYINVPYVSNATAFDGINAYYMDETAGLLIKAGAQAFGSDVTGFNDETSYTTNDAKLKQPYSNVSAVSKLTLQEGSTLTIPNLKAGQYVRMRWLRYSSLQGDLVKVSNLKDLDGTEITKSFRVGSRQGGSTKKGYQEFIVMADGDVTFTLQPEGTNRGYVDIEEIAVSATKLSTDLKMTPTTYYYPKGVSTVLTLNSTGYTSSLAPTYSVASTKTEGSDDFAYSLSGDKLTVSAGQGIVTATAKEYTTKDSNIAGGDQQDVGSYVLDEVSAPITILKYATTTQTYPYTWDFKKYSTSHFSNMTTTTSGTTSDVWTVENSSSKAKYTLNRDSWNYVLGDELRDANGNAVAEAQGLGFSAVRGSGSTLVYRTGDDIQFGTVADTIHIPTVPTDSKVYMLIKGGSSTSIVTADGTALTGEAVASTVDVDGVKGQTNWYLYTIQGTGKTIDVALANVNLRVVAVTNMFKTFNHLDGMMKSYATEYRDQAERYELTDLFTNGASPVTANIVSSVSDDRATTSPITVAPKYTGVILSTTNQSTPTEGVPLFVPDINTSTTKVSTNYLKGVLTDSTITTSGTNVNYIFTPYYYKVDESGSTTTDKKQGTLAFYKQLSNDGTQLGAHKAYLQIPQTASAKQYIFISAIENGDVPSAIRIPQTVSGDNDVYYTLGGQRLQGQPVQPGIYVRNGKKIMVK
jgi:hypothetical protein